MNDKTPAIFVAVCNHRIVYAKTNLNGFVNGMREIEPRFLSKDTLRKRLSADGFASFVGKKGDVYHLYSYDNPNYYKLK